MARSRAALAYHLKVYVGGIEFDEDRIPVAILSAGLQQMPV